MSSARRVVFSIVAAAATVAVAVAVGGGGAGGGGAASAQAAPGDDVRINEIQVIGSHNSYHLVPSEPEVALRRSFIGAGDDLMQYQHLPLPRQFAEQKVRQIELDVFHDPVGGRYATPLLRSVAGVTDPLDPAMSEPGLKVLHIQDVDYATTCVTLEGCLREVKAWSDANGNHVPIAILLELKDTPLDLFDLPFVVPLPFDAAAMDEVDAVIRRVFGPEDLITPDDVRGDHATLPGAIAEDGWPTLGESRGKVMFLMDNGGGYRTTYLAGNPNLAGRPMFTSGVVGQPDAAFIKRNDSGDASIPDLVRAGYVVRTRADGDTVEARNNDTGPRDAALASGAQWVSTDYPVRDYGLGFETDYVAEIPGGTVARCNPVNAPASCVSADLEPPLPTEPPTTDTTSAPTSDTTATTAGGGGVGGVGAAPGATPVRGTTRYTG